MTHATPWNLPQVRQGHEPGRSIWAVCFSIRASGPRSRLRPLPAGVTTLARPTARWDYGAITQSEFEILQFRITPPLLDLQRVLVIDLLRSRVLDGLERTVEPAWERSLLKFVFTHVMSPHARCSSRADRAPVDGRPCYPKCSAFDHGWTFGEECAPSGLLAGQIAYIDDRVAETLWNGSCMRAPNRRPTFLLEPWGRHCPTDRPEMLQSLLVVPRFGTARPG